MGALSGLIASSGLEPLYVNGAFNASPGRLYQCDTSAAGFTVTLPTGTSGAVMRFVDDQGTWGTNALRIAPAATQTIQGIAAGSALNCNLSGAYVELTWDATKSWWVVQSTGFQYGPAASTTARGIVYAQKQYVVGTAYTNGTPSVTNGQTGWSLTRGVLVPYQTSDGAWRLRFNIAGSFSSTSLASTTLNISGITFKNVASFYQSVSGMWIGSGNGAVFEAYTNPNSNTVSFVASSTTTETGLSVSGDVELDSKPTWAD